MRKRDIVAHVIIITLTIFTISNYENLTLSDLLFHTITMFLYGAGVSLELARFVIKLAKKEVE